MSRTSARFSKVLSLIVLCAALLAVGCSETPVDSTVNDGPTVLTRASRSTGSASASPVNLYTEATISSETGGQLVLLDVILDVPVGAVPNDTLFSISIPDDEVFYNEFGTHGLVFDVPVTVTMSYRDADLSGIDENTIRIGWLNGATGEWCDVECTVDHLNKTVTGQLDHFSAYGLISD